MKKLILALAALCWASPAVAGPIVTARPVIVARPVTTFRAPVTTYRAPTPTPKSVYRPAYKTPTPARRVTSRPTYNAPIPSWWMMTNMGVHTTSAEYQFKEKCRRTPPEKRNLTCKKALRQG